MIKAEKSASPIEKKWRIKLFVFLLFPTVILLTGLSILDNAQKDRYIEKIGQKIDAEFEIMASFADTEFFFAKSFQDLIKEKNAQKVALAVADLRSEVGKDFDYLVWDENINLVSSSISPSSFKGDWEMGWKTLSAYFTLRNNYTNKISRQERINIRKLFGPQFLVENSYQVDEMDKGLLVWPDTTKNHPLTWAYSNQKFKVAFFVKYSALKKLSGVIAQIRKKNKENLPYKFNLLKKGKLLIPEIEDSLELQKHLSNIALDASSKKRFHNYIIFSRIISDFTQAVAIVPLKRVPSQFPIPPSAFAILFLLLSFILLSKNGWHRAITSPGKATISSKLALVFLIANGFPLSILLFLGFNYLEQKQFALQDEVYANSVGLIQNFDERFESEYFRKILKIRRGKKFLLPDLKSKKITAQKFHKFLEIIGDETSIERGFKVFLVASDTELMASRYGIFHGNKLEPLPGKYYLKQYNRPEIHFFQKIFQYFIASMNGKNMDEVTATEIEVLAESVVQKTLPEILQEFLESLGKTTNIGIGYSKSPGYFDAISVSDNRQTDYILIINWTDSNTQIDYLNHQFTNLNRNLLNLKVVVMAPREKKFYPPEAAAEKELIKLYEDLSERPSPPRKFVNFKGEKHLLVALKGRHLNKFALYGLYPANIIEREINTQKKILLLASFLTLLLSIGLGQLLAISFLYPLSIISAGALAIEQRQFDLRLPSLGKDEFGDMANIFNESMVDLEELKVAGFIQEHLLPNEPINSGHFDLYGKSIPMGDLGGDYFDYFETSEDKFSVLIGDVAGHGVGAALIMAMAKAGILLSEDLLERPAQILNRLHQLIFEAKTQKQRKIMTFQYFSLNGKTGDAIYANAGGWSPLFFEKETGKIQEITLTALVLGAFKKVNYTEINFSFKPGDALILYTDGIIECQNFSGEMFGFTNFKELVTNSYDPDPQKFYKKILHGYNQHLEGRAAQDDLTIIVLVFNQGAN